jgi:hypothetical protein
MAIVVVLQDENCNNISDIIEDPQGVIALSLPNISDRTYCCLRFIDPYGDTIFNRIQAIIMVEEWDKLEQSFSNQNAETLWVDIRKLIVQCSEEPHTYLRFIGD